LQNIVATVNLDCRLDLKTIALHARNAEYNPKRFAAVIMRIREPKTTALIFASGKMVVTGAKSEDDSKLASRKYARIIQKLGFNAKFVGLLVGSFSLLDVIIDVYSADGFQNPKHRGQLRYQVSHSLGRSGQPASHVLVVRAGTFPWFGGSHTK
jgi:hypothetical protein